ncbi:MAG TPA: bifunctional riboflavin kinase/FAD synthetase [Dehalococcoidia bacterium]|nr:bifunctional riboflavin kinase/FAD synthetase [Dehalococcoidia bacterium]
MRVEEELAKFTPQREAVLTIGVFDGVHLGHQHLIQYLKRQALVRDYLGGVVTFANHPQQFLSPQTSLACLTSLEEKVGLLRQLDIELIVPLSFTLELAQLPAHHFVYLLQKHLKMRGLVVGPDFALGQGREGDVFFLHSLGKEAGFTVDVVSPKVIDGEPVSSTIIRQALAQGDMQKVNRLLGRPFSLSGQVAHGVERGKHLGSPTANLSVNSAHALPADGVYVTKAYLSNHAYPSVTNIGFRPTFGEGERTVEVYLLDFEGRLYGKELKIELLERLRDERRFPNPEELKAQISRDVEQAREILEKGEE